MHPGPASMAAFASVVGHAFSVEYGPGRTVALQLTSVTPAASPAPGGAGPEDAARQAFALLFRGPEQPFLEQATYRFSHPTLGTQPIFIVPVGREGEGFLYEAVFS